MRGVYIPSLAFVPEEEDDEDGVQMQKDCAEDLDPTSEDDHVACLKIIHEDEEDHVQDVQDETSFSYPQSFMELLENSSRDKFTLLTHATLLAQGEPKDQPVAQRDIEFETTRKSERAPKMSMKMKRVMADEMVSCRKEKVQKMKDLSKLHSRKVLQDFQPSDVSKVCQVDDLTEKDEETILMRYLNVRTIDELYRGLKDAYMRMKNSMKSSLARSHASDCNFISMREKLVHCLLQEGRVVVQKKRGRCLLLEDVEVIM